MRFLKSNFLKRIVVIITVIMILLSSMSSCVYASKVKMGENDFYYAGTSKGQYKVSMSILAWLLEFIKQIAGFLFGLITMIPRMAIVGWTAIFELVLTTALNSFTGVPMDDTNLNATNVDANGTANHVTVQAIVFNQVPVLNCNLFDFDDKEKMNTCIDGTGHYWIHCETCAKNDPLIAANPSRPHLCRMKGQCKCTECAAYREAFGVKEDDENPYLIIKENVAMWYYIMRLMAAAAMLAVLIYVGIKIAITTVASEKAVFKRMLVDWVVGAIILFSTQYIMSFIISVNEGLISVMATIEEGMKEKTKKEFHKEEKEVINDELELDLYQEVRTRAYDAKGVNGVSGMLMYIALVAMAYRYTLIYLRRLFTVIILTLMAPGIAFSYAIQKVSTGKSSAFSKWLQEYMVNVLSQAIHALIYVSFISYALMISLDSIPGTIYALVVMHYMPKFDETFRKIFKFNGSGLHDEDIKSTSAKQLAATARHAGAMVGAAAMVSKMSPVGKIATAPLKGAIGGVSLLKAGVGTKIADKVMDSLAGEQADTMVEGLQDIGAVLALDAPESKEYSSYLEEGNEYREDLVKAIKEETDAEKKQALIEELDEFDNRAGLREQDIFGKEIDKRINSALKTLEKDPENREAAAKLAQAMKLKEAFDKTTTLDDGTRLGKLKNFAFTRAAAYKQKYNPDKYSKLVQKSDGTVVRKMRLNPFAFHYDPHTNKLVGDGAWQVARDNSAFLKTISKNGGVGMVRKLIFQPAKLAQEFVDNTNYSPEMKKLLGKQAQLTANIVVGALATGAGMMTLVSNPAMGMGLLAYGMHTRQDFKQAYGLDDPNRYAVRRDKVAQKYTFSKFSVATQAAIGRAALELAESAQVNWEEADIPGLTPRAQRLRIDMASIIKSGGRDISAISGSVGSFSRNRMKYKKLHPGAKFIGNFATGGFLSTARTVTASGAMGLDRQNVSTQSLLYKIGEQANKEINSNKDDLIRDTLSFEMEATRLEYEAKKDSSTQMYADLLAMMDAELQDPRVAETAGVSVTAQVERPVDEKGNPVFVPQHEEKEEGSSSQSEPETKTKVQVEEETIDTVILSGEINRSAQSIVERAVAEQVLDLAKTGKLPAGYIKGDDSNIRKAIKQLMVQNGLGDNLAAIEGLDQKIEQTSQRMIADAKAMQEGREIPADSDHRFEKVIVDIAVAKTVRDKAAAMSDDAKAAGPIKANGTEQPAKPKKTLQDFLNSEEFESKVRDAAQRTVLDVAFGGSVDKVTQQLNAARGEAGKPGGTQGKTEQGTTPPVHMAPESAPEIRAKISERAVTNGVQTVRAVNERRSKLGDAIQAVGRAGTTTGSQTSGTTSGKPTEASTSNTQMKARKKISIQDATIAISDDLMRMVAPSPEEEAQRLAQQRSQETSRNVDSVLGSLLESSGLSDSREAQAIQANLRSMQRTLKKMQYLNQEAATSNIKAGKGNREYNSAQKEADVLKAVLDSVPLSDTEGRAKAEDDYNRAKGKIANNGPMLNIVEMLKDEKKNAVAQKERESREEMLRTAEARKAQTNPQPRDGGQKKQNPNSNGGNPPADGKK